MKRIKHRFINHTINPKTEILIIGTFNPDTEENIADFFYGRSRNFLWTLLATAYNEASLKGQPRDEKLKFIEKNKIDFIDLIAEVEVEEVNNYRDSYLDKNNIKWRDVISEIDKLPHLKRVCLTRNSFRDIPNMKMRIEEIKSYCEEKNLPFQLLPTPARFHNQAKQTEWTNFFNDF